MPTLRVPPCPGVLIAARHVAGTVLLATLFATTAAGQVIRPTPPIIVPPGGGGAGGGGAGGGGGIGTLPIFPGGPGIGLPGTTAPEPTIVVARGALAGQSVTAAIAFPATETGQATAATYQWSITGGRLTSDPRERTVDFVADRTGIVTLAATVGANGTAYNPTAQVTVFGADAAGSVTAPARVVANATTVTATVPAARNGDRTFRWTVSGDATITGGQGTRTVTFRPGTAGLKQVTCNVTLQSLVTVPVRAYLVVTGSGPEVEVAVQGGSGGGTFRAGSRVDVFAHPPAAGEVFDRWTGDTALLDGGALAATLARTTLTVPERPVTLTATYRPAPAWSPAAVRNFTLPAQAAASTPATTRPQTTAAPAAPGLVYHVPGDAAGLVFLLHDAGDTGASWFERPEPLLFVRELVAAGFGVAAVDSANRTAGTWSTATTLATNADALDHAAALDRLIGEGAIAPTTPVFFVGVGNGGDAAARLADLLAAARPARPVRGAVLYLAAGNETLAAASRVPQLFALAANDETLGAEGQAAARENSRLLVGRGVATGVVNQTVSPLLPGRLRMLSLSDPGFTAADADAVWTAVKETGALDTNHYVQTPPTAAALAAALPAAYRSRARDVADQVAVAAAGRAFSADSNRRVIAFLQARTASAPTAAPGRVVNLSTRAQVAYLGDTFTLGFTLTGNQRATLLIRGIGPGLARFGVRDAIPAQRLEVRHGSTLVAANETWGQADNAAQIAAAAGAVGAFALPPGSLDSALLVNLEPGTYLATIAGLNGTVGDVLGEIYDVSRNGTRITNLSVLANVSGAGEVVIPGLVIAGNNPRTLLVRAVGPSLAGVGLPAASLLPDPRVTVFSGNQVVANNNNWAQAGAATLNAVTALAGAFPLANPSDAALVSALAPGSYTLQTGAAPAAGPTVASGMGTVLVEVYEVP